MAFVTAIVQIRCWSWRQHTAWGIREEFIRMTCQFCTNRYVVAKAWCRLKGNPCRSQGKSLSSSAERQLKLCAERGDRPIGNKAQIAPTANTILLPIARWQR